jgi:hypothetical protein
MLRVTKKFQGIRSRYNHSDNIKILSIYSKINKKISKEYTKKHNGAYKN